MLRSCPLRQQLTQPIAPRPPAATTYKACRTTCSAGCIRWCARKPTARRPACLPPEPSKNIQRFSLAIFERILELGAGETFQTQTAGVAQAAWPAALIGIVTTVRQPQIHAELSAQFNNLAFGELDQRRVNLNARAAFHPGFRRQIRHAL